MFTVYPEPSPQPSQPSQPPQAEQPPLDLDLDGEFSEELLIQVVESARQEDGITRAIQLGLWSST